MRAGTAGREYMEIREFRAAMRHLILAFVVWPLLVIDIHGILLALKELFNREKNEPAAPELWPEWDD